MYATIANDGVRVEPTLVAGTTSPDGTFTRAPAPQTTRVVSAQTAATVRAMLESVVSDEGTAPQASIPGYRVAGKTGTANRVDPDCGCYRGYTASFIGFAPADDPRLVVSVVLQNPRHGHFGGQLAAPVFKTVMTFALQSLEIPPTGRRRRGCGYGPADPGSLAPCPLLTERAWRVRSCRRARWTSLAARLRAAAATRGRTADRGHRRHPRLARRAARRPVRRAARQPCPRRRVHARRRSTAARSRS